MGNNDGKGSRPDWIPAWKPGPYDVPARRQSVDK